MREKQMIIEPTDHWKREEDKLFRYLESLNEEAKRINGDNSIVFKSFRVWLKLHGSILDGTLEVPDCYPNNGSGGDFHIMFTWDRDEHYLECEIDVEGKADFFYRNLLTKETWGYTYDSSNPKFPDSDFLLEKLSFFTH